MLLRFCFFLLMAGAATAEQTCCVDEDIAAAFMRSSYSRSVPDSFPIGIESAELELIGSSIMPGGLHTTVAWKSEESPADARKLVTGILKRESWRLVPESERVRSMYQRGFVTQRPMSTESNQQFCRDRAGTLTIHARSAAIGTVVTLSHYADRTAPDCEAVIAAQRHEGRHDLGLIRHLPALALPESVKMPAHRGSGSGGGGDRAYASLTVETAVSPRRTNRTLL